MNNDRPDQLPKARKKNLIVKELEDETLVYDLERDEAHCLNSTAARVWKNCDGTRTVAELRTVIQSEAASGVPEEIVWLALDQLEKFRLLDDTSSKAFQLPGMTRRDLVRRVGLAALALPLVVSISTSPAQAQTSLLPPGRCCQSNNDCVSNDCSQNPTCTPPPPSNPATKACA